MVYESRVGDVFALGATSWRIEDITHDRVLVSPAPGQPGRLPFWKGDTLGRPAELGAAVGAFIRELGALDAGGRGRAGPRHRARRVGRRQPGQLPHRAARGHRHPAQRPHLVVERFRDELGDWRLVVHSPYGAPVHAPWALAIGARLRERYGVDAQAMACDDGIVLRIPETDQDPPGAEVVVFEPDEIEDLVTTEVGGSALFAARFRECAARALLLPRRDPGRRSPLWQQRQRSAQLLEVATKYPSFPIVLEAVREVLQDVYDVPALVGLHAEARPARGPGGRGGHHAARRPSPGRCCSATSPRSCTRATPRSPSAAPPRSRSTRACSPSCSAAPSCASCSTPRCSTEIEAELQRLAPDRRARDAEGVADLLRLLGPLTTDEVAERCVPGADAAAWLTELADVPPRGRGPGRRRAALGRRRGRRPAARRARRAGPAGHARGVHRAGRRPARRPGLPLRPHPRPVHDRRRRRPLRARRRGRPADAAAAGRRRPGGRGRVPARPARGSEWCDAEVLRRLRRRSLAALRKEVEPVEPATLGRFLPAWQHVPPAAAGLRGVDGRADGRRAAGRLRGARLGAGAAGAGRPGQRLRAGDARRAHRHRRGGLGRSRHAARHRRLGQPAPRRHGAAHPARAGRARPVARCTSRCWRRSRRGGAYFFRQLSDAVGSTDDQALATALWDLVWSGRVSNDTLAPLRRTHPVRGRPPIGVGVLPRGRGRLAAARHRLPTGGPARGGPPDGRPGAGRCCPSATPTRPAARTRPPRRCSSGTAWSPAARSAASGCPAASPASTRCCRRSRSPGGAAAATS